MNPSLFAIYCLVLAYYHGMDSMKGNVMTAINIQYFKLPYAEFVLGTYQNKLCLCDFRYRKMRTAIDKRIQTALGAVFIERNDALLVRAKRQLSEYFFGERSTFDIPLLTVGSDFQRSVWHALENVKYGETASYLDLAKSVANEKSVRAVGHANGANALAIFIPCHRILGNQGKLVGYAGGLPLKQRLLSLEQNLLIQ